MLGFYPLSAAPLGDDGVVAASFNFALTSTNITAGAVVISNPWLNGSRRRVVTIASPSDNSVLIDSIVLVGNSINTVTGSAVSNSAEIFYNS